MVGFLGRIFGSPKAIAAGMELISSGIDKSIYTEEEKADTRLAQASIEHETLIGWLNASQGQALARRTIALLLTVMWMVLYTTAAVLAIASIWVQAAMLASTTVQQFADNLTGAMTLILVFYFAAPHMGGIVGTALAKFNKGPSSSTSSQGKQRT